MQNHEVILESPASDTYFATKAAQSVDLNLKEKLRHHLKIKADVKTHFNVGLILGSSGSGKTTLCQSIWGADCFEEDLNPGIPIIDQMEGTYDERVGLLNGVGLSAVPCWVRVAGTLSNGQKFRAQIARSMSMNKELTIVDEWTSVVDRTVAKVMSHAISKHIRREGRTIVLCSCHYDVVEWLNPDWIIDCNKETYSCYRGRLRQRSERLQFDIKECSSRQWKNFSKYHYLTASPIHGPHRCYGLFHRADQIGMATFAQMYPRRPRGPVVYHGTKVVIHPDYVGLGLGLRMVEEAAELFYKEHPNIEIRSTSSNVPMIRSQLKRQNKWRLENIEQKFKRRIALRDHHRFRVKTYSFLYVPKNFANKKFRIDE